MYFATACQRCLLRFRFAGKAGNVEKLMEKYGDSKKSFAILVRIALRGISDPGPPRIEIMFELL